MEYTRVKQLIEKYFNNTLSDEEREQLLQMTEDKNNASLMKRFQEMLADDAGTPVAVNQERLEQSLAKVLDVDKPRSTRRVLNLSWLRYAAAVLVLGGIGIYAWLKSVDQYEPAATTTGTQSYVNDVAPGGQKAMLTLADGRTILLDSAADGQLVSAPGIRILKKGGQLIYTSLGDDQEAMTYNTLKTPKGGMYQLSLPDGTRVWLNAASAISYPVRFTGKERVVEMNGEAYFEVAKNARMPFKVKINDKNSVEVLGTHFNIKAYADENVISTTLLEGAVRMASDGKRSTLKPGQQALASVNQLSVKTIGETGISKVMAWKEGRFNFQDANLQEIMRQLSRWYGVEVVYESKIPDLEFIGEIERSLPLSEVLRGLKMSGVNSRLEKGNRLVIFP